MKKLLYSLAAVLAIAVCTPDSFTSRKDITRTTKAQFSGLEPGHTYYYAVCCQVKWRQDGYTMTEDYISEVRSFTTGQ